MLADYITPGDRLEITASEKEGAAFKSGDLGEEEFYDVNKSYRTRVYDLLTDDVISVEMPMDKTKLVLLPVGGSFDLCFYTRRGLYQCYARVIDRYRTNNVYILELQLTTNLRKFQRREYYRFSCVLDMQCRRLLPEEEERMVNHEVEFIDTDILLEDGMIVDISGGGARFVSETQYEVGTFILFEFSLEIDGKPKRYSIIGRVVDSSMPPGRDSYENRIKFININDKDRESIIKYIFEEERKIRNREFERRS